MALHVITPLADRFQKTKPGRKVSLSDEGRVRTLLPPATCAGAEDASAAPLGGSSRLRRAWDAAAGGGSRRFGSR